MTPSTPCPGRRFRGWATGRPAIDAIPPLVAEDHVCASCGLSYPETDIGAAADLLGSLPARYRRSIDGLSAATLRRRPEPGTWSITEYLCHKRTLLWLVRQAAHEGIHHLGDIERQRAIV